jgi:dihydroorotase
MNPPLRSPEDNQILWQALRDGVIDFIATDHAPHTLEEKAQAYPNSPSGMPGVETSLPLMLTQAEQGCCTIAQVADWMSTAVAKHYKIPNKGAIAPGYDADLVLVDLNTYRPVLAEQLLTKCGWSPFTFPSPRQERGQTTRRDASGSCCSTEKKSSRFLIGSKMVGTRSYR